MSKHTIVVCDHIHEDGLNILTKYRRYKLCICGRY